MKEQSIALYARVSSEQQAEAGTIDSQIVAVQERIVQDGYQVSKDLIFVDEGYSGASLIRPGLERLRDEVARNSIDRLYVLAPDRLARKYAYQVLLIEEFRRAGVEVVFFNRAVGQTPEDNLLLQMQGMIAEYERAQILERSRRGKRHSAQSGEVEVLSGAPFGYRYISKQDGGGQAQYEVVAEQAQTVRQIFWWVGIERVSLGEVRRRLKQAGTVSPKGKPTWDRTTVWGILKNPAYQGTAAFGKTRSGPLRPRLRAQRGRLLQPRRAVSSFDRPESEWTLIPVPALVEPGLFEAVQNQLQENRQRARQSQRGARYLLQGLLVCAQCGYAYYGKPVSHKSAKGKQRDYAYYRCIGSDAFRFGGERICDNLQVRTDQLEQTVWREVCDLLQDRQRLQQEYERRLNVPKLEDQNLTLIQAQRGKIQQGMARLIDSYAEGFVKKDEFEPRITRLRQRLGVLEKQVEQIQDQAHLQLELQTAIRRLEEFGEKVKVHLGQADWQMQRELIRTLVKRVEIGKEEVNVVFRIQPDPEELDPTEQSLHHCWGSKRTTLGRTLFRVFKQPTLHYPGFEHRFYQCQDAFIFYSLCDQFQ
ncbi:MAG: Resolvase domain protein [Bacteroidetes bacterium]|nr:Resolvase domain protein [Bacteroidota bacterium]